MATKKKRKTKAPSQEWSGIKGVKRERLIYERKKRGLTQSQVAEILGISTSMVSHIENGRFIPNAETCIRLQELYGVPYEILIPDF